MPTITAAVKKLHQHAACLRQFIGAAAYQVIADQRPVGVAACRIIEQFRDAAVKRLGDLAQYLQRRIAVAGFEVREVPL